MDANWSIFYSSLAQDEKDWLVYSLETIDISNNKISWIIPNNYIHFTIKAFQLLSNNTIKYKVTPELRNMSEVVIEWEEGSLKIFN